MAGFNLAQARADGRSDDEIFDYLTKSRPKFNAQQAIADGKSKQEIIDYLSSTPAPSNGPRGMEQLGDLPGAPPTRLPAALQKHPEWEQNTLGGTAAHISWALLSLGWLVSQEPS